MNASRRCDCLGHDAAERTLTKLATHEPNNKSLFILR